MPSRGSHNKRPEPLFEPLNFFMLRAPLFPREAYTQLHTVAAETASGLSVLNPHVRLALSVASRSLFDAIERQNLSPRAALRREKKLLRYLIRMSTRPTPYGLFAGVALGDWGAATDLSIAHPMARLQVGLDMGWLMPLIWRLEASQQVRRHLRVFANSAAYFRGGRVFLHERATADASDEIHEVSLRATRVVKHTLEVARHPIAYTDLTASLLASIPEATEEKVEALLTLLWQQTLLLTDLRPPLTGEVHPASYLQRRLADLPPTTALAKQLAAILEQIHTWEMAPLDFGLEQYHSLLQQIKDFLHTPEATFGATAHSLHSSPLPEAGIGRTQKMEENQFPELLQVTMGMDLRGHTLSKQVGIDAVRMAELLLRLTPFPQGPIDLANYRQAFLQRYQQDQEVPLVELIDPNFGLGAPLATAAPHEEEQHSARRNQALIEIALLALHKRQLVVELNEATIERLQTWNPTSDTAPSSLDLNIFVGAASATDIDAGCYQLVLGPNIGGRQGGSNFGRFATLLGREGLQTLRETATRVSRLASEKLLAEMVYLPEKGRASNVAIRPNVYSYELCYATSPGTTFEHTIPLDELVVGLRNDTFFLRWPQKNVEVIPRASHMLTSTGAPPLIRLLTSIGLDGTPLLTPFNWGGAATFPFLPRVQVGRLVLSLAQWRISTDIRDRELPLSSLETFRAALATWRACWNVPRYVYLSMMDNRLLLDLESLEQCDELRTELQSLPPDGALILQEVFPVLDQAWVHGPGGHYITECVVPLIRRETPKISHSTAASTDSAASKNLIPREQRLKAPGSEWLFVKLYVGLNLQEDLIAGPLRFFAHDALKEGLAQDWFFIRYSDPDPHIRLRFSGDPSILRERLLPSLCQWSSSLMMRGTCLHFAFDTYDREIERYGGLAGIGLAERLFGADSRAVADLVALLSQAHTLELEKDLLAALSVDDLLASLGVSGPMRLKWYHQRVKERKQAGQTYRQKRVSMRSLLNDPASFLATLAGGREVLLVLEKRREEVLPVAEQLATLDRQEVLSQSFTSLYSSYVHMHCNRLLGLNRLAEEEVIGLLLRTYEGLERAPVTH